MSTIKSSARPSSAMYQAPRTHWRLILLIACAVLLSSALCMSSSVSAAYAARSGYHLHYMHTPPRYLGSSADALKLACESPAAVNRCFLPHDLYTVYNIRPLLERGITGKGRTIVIIDASQSPTLQHDLALFDKLFGLPNPTLNVIAPFGLGPYSVDDATEITLDVEMAHAIAPDATINLALAPTLSNTDVFKITQYAVVHDLGDTISQSFGENEQCDSVFVQAEHQLFVEAAAKNISVFASSGDFGSAIGDCQTGFPSIQGVSYPASDTEVTAVGGTTLYADTQSRYVGETVWNQSRFGQGPANNASGGGFSRVFARPDYQAGIAALKGQRTIPDIAYNADADKSAVLLVCGSCGFGPNALIGLGGTSSGSPQWAAITVLADQLAGQRLGFLNPALYNIGGARSRTRAFHDVVLGNNTYAYSTESGLRVVIPGYSATKRWDPATGWGSPNAAELAELLAG